jgi:hypothetical protein
MKFTKLKKALAKAALACTATAALMTAATTAALAAAPPDTITPPKGLNLGSTSFFDAFGRQTPGFTLIEYQRYEDIDKITGPNGQPNPLFSGPKLHVGVTLTQLFYTTDLHPFGGTLAFSAALPVVEYMQAKFASNSIVKLSNNGTNIGDLVWGPIWQSKVYKKNGRPYFVWRTQLIISSPTGALDHSKNLNQGVGFWAINPYVTFSWLPTDKIEISSRFNYQYNFQGSDFSSPPPIPHYVYKNGQGGDIIYDNFTASYKVASGVNIGINGYFLDELSPDKTNGQIVPHSRVNSVYLGPGAHFEITPSNLLNVNLYLPVVNNNDSVGTKGNIQFIHRF